MTTMSPNHEAILQAVERWPVEEQVMLARTILARVGVQPNTLSEDPGDKNPATSTWDALYGLAATEHEPPSDDQVAQWREERLEKKYG